MHEQQSEPRVPKQPKCLGIFGTLFGHKFIKSGCYAETWNKGACWRCGFKPGIKL